MNPIQQLNLKGINQKKLSSEEEGLDFENMILQMMSLMMEPQENQNLKEEAQLITSKDFFAELPSMTVENVKHQLSALFSDVTQENLSEEGRVFSETTETTIDKNTLQKLLEQVVNVEGDSQEQIPHQEADTNSLEKLSKLPEKLSEPLEKLSKELEKVENFSMENQKPSRPEKVEKDIFTRDVSFMGKEKDVTMISMQHEKNLENPESINRPLVKEMTIGETAKDRLKDMGEKTDSKTVPLNSQELLFSKIVEEKTHSPQGPVEMKNTQEIIHRMATEIKELKEGESTLLQVKLKPKELGEIEIKLEMKAGEIVGKVFVENLTTKGILDSQISYIKDALKNQNISVQDMEVNLQSNTQEQSQQRGQESFFQNKKGSSSKDTHPYDREINTIDHKGEPINQPCGYENGYKKNGNTLNILA